MNGLCLNKMKGVWGMEFKRIISKRYIIVMLFFLLIFNSFIFIKEQNDKILENDVSIEEIANVKKGLLEEYKNMPIQQAYNKNELKLEELRILSNLITYMDMEESELNEEDSFYEKEYNRLRNQYPELVEQVNKNPGFYNAAYFYIEHNAANSLKKSMEHILNYPEYFENMDRQKEEMSEISIMQSKFALLNANKTTEDYSNIRNLSLDFGIDEGIVSFISFKLTPYLILFLSILLILDFVSERESEIWKIVYSTPNGRGVLARKRLIILVLSIIGVSLLFYLSLFLISMTIYGGWEDLGRMVQSISLFQNFTIPMTVIQFIGYYFLINILSILVTSLLFWFVLTIANSHKFGLLILGILMVVEWSFYTFIPGQSVVSLLKYINFYTYINMSTDMIEYRNVGVFSGVINKNIIMLITLLFFICLLIFLCIYVNSKVNPYRIGHMTILKVKISKTGSKVKNSLFGKLGFIGTELYKILFHQKGILLLFALVLLLQQNISSEKIYFSSTDYIVNDFYEAYGGKITKGTRNYLKEWQTSLLQADQVSNPERALNEQRAINKILKHVNYLDNLEDTTGIEGWLVNPRSYEHLLGVNYSSKQVVYEAYALVFLILILSGVFSYERKNNMKIILHTTNNGRERLFLTKIVAMSIVITLIWLLTYGHELFELNRHYGFPLLDAPLQSLPFLLNVNIPCKIGTFIILVMILRLILLIFITFIIGYLSNKVNLMKSMIISLIILVIPEFLSILKVQLLDNVSVIRIMNGTNFLLTDYNCRRLGLSMLIIFIVGLLALYKTKNDWCKG